MAIAVTVLGLVACDAGDVSPSAADEYNRGRSVGWGQALEAVRDCAADSRAGEFADCLAAQGAVRTSGGTSQDRFDEFLSVGTEIEVAFVVYANR